MRTILIIAALFHSITSFSQIFSERLVKVRLRVEDVPTTLKLVGRDTSYLFEVERIAFENAFEGLKIGNYEIMEIFKDDIRSLEDSVVIGKDQILILKITHKSCPYYYSKNYIPKCPGNHTDNIVPIIYGLLAPQSVREQINPDAKPLEPGSYYLGGCVVTSCDPEYYCKTHRVRF